MSAPPPHLSLVPTPPAVTDVLIFQDTPVGVHRVGWSGPWPPPQRMVVIMQGRGQDRRVGAVVEAELVTEDWLAQARGTTLNPLWFRLQSASAMPEPAGPEEHWCRGAAYTLETEEN